MLIKVKTMVGTTVWRKACGATLRWSRGVAAAGSHSSLQAVLNPIHDEEARRKGQKLQQARRWVSKRSALVEPGGASGNVSLYPLFVQQSRFSSSVASDAAVGDKGLLHVLRCEVEYLTKKRLDISPRRPPKPFTLVKDEAEEMEMTLTRIYGLEDISISCVMQVVRKEFQRKPEVGEDPESRTKMLQLTISITRGGSPSTLKILCECYRDGFTIHQVDLEDEAEEQSVYRPYFSESKEELVRNFQIFLYERGLNGDLSSYMEKHLERKRLTKSAGVIEKIARFLEADGSITAGCG